MIAKNEVVWRIFILLFSGTGCWCFWALNNSEIQASPQDVNLLQQIIAKNEVFWRVFICYSTKSTNNNEKWTEIMLLL